MFNTTAPHKLRTFPSSSATLVPCPILYATFRKLTSGGIVSIILAQCPGGGIRHTRQVEDLCPSGHAGSSPARGTSTLCRCKKLRRRPPELLRSGHHHSPISLPDSFGSLVVCMVALPSDQFFATNDTNPSTELRTSFHQFSFFRVNSCNSWQISQLDPAKS